MSFNSAISAFADPAVATQPLRPREILAMITRLAEMGRR